MCWHAVVQYGGHGVALHVDKKCLAPPLHVVLVCRRGHFVSTDKIRYLLCLQGGIDIERFQACRHIDAFVEAEANKDPVKAVAQILDIAAHIGVDARRINIHVDIEEERCADAIPGYAEGFAPGRAVPNRDLRSEKPLYRPPARADCAGFPRSAHRASRPLHGCAEAATGGPTPRRHDEQCQRSQQ